MRFSVGLFASLAAQAVFAAPALVPTKTPSVVVVALDAVKDAQGTLDTQSADLSMYSSSWSPPPPPALFLTHPEQRLGYDWNYRFILQTGVLTGIIRG